MPTAHDYRSSLDKHAAALGATIVDIQSQQAMKEEPGQILQGVLSGYSPRDCAFSNTRTRKLYIQLPVESDCDYVIAMHELGHIATTPLDTPVNVESEALASQWALDNSDFPVTRQAAGLMQEALESYEEYADCGKPGPVAKRLTNELHALQA